MRTVVRLPTPRKQIFCNFMSDIQDDGILTRIMKWTTRPPVFSIHNEIQKTLKQKSCARNTQNK
ncbi:hypothetical protein L798_04375 [Zootermopsis nevadensis]|uniref:Uncharacterized protein n=1 Tax=Zootermopsis nevadensis TaxID=136037 RepID=A0A067RJE6_ZOONE|nr:hypothetical protein L798_04375 [Zootermopsis nevadensis]